MGLVVIIVIRTVTVLFLFLFSSFVNSSFFGFSFNAWFAECAFC